jgi:Na+/H+ antiporter NhaC
VALRPAAAPGQEPQETPSGALELSIEHEGIALSGVPFDLAIHLSGPAPESSTTIAISGGGHDQRVELVPGDHVVRWEAGLDGGLQQVTARAGSVAAQTEVRVIPGWLSIIPPVVAIGLALIFKDVLLSLTLGVFTGALFLCNWNPLSAFALTIDRFVTPSLADSDHASIIIFSVLLGGMVGVISRSGGTQGIVDRLTRFATTPRRGQLSTWVLGVVIFFDDYANTLIVGSTMRPITDRLRISREKLAYIVDSTAAPVASVVPISTWVGFEIGLIAAAFTQLGIDGEYNAYAVLVSSISYRFYPIFALIFGFTIAATCRDFGPMLAAERRASASGALIADGDVPLALANSEETQPPAHAPMRAMNALLPILTVIVVTLSGLWVSGRGAVVRTPDMGTLDFVREVFSNSDSFGALRWASLAGVVVAIVLALVQRILSVRQTMEALVAGFRSMLLAIVVLVLAWSIGAVCADLHTADYAVGLTSGILSPHWVPVLVFLLSAAIAFATGASWGTMAILMPIVIPVCHGLSTAAGHPPGSAAYTTILVGTISSVLAGSVWGDHCSPISDTTILSSMGSGCDHIAHVRTQIPYALGVGLLGMLVGDIPTAFGMSSWVAIAIGAILIVVGVRFFGHRSDWQPTP